MFLTNLEKLTGGAVAYPAIGNLELHARICFHTPLGYIDNKIEIVVHIESCTF